jgi:hypothetical protein
VFINLIDIVGLAFDKKGRLYVLENTTGNQFPTPGTGKIVRVDGPNNYICNRAVIADRDDFRSGWKPVCFELGIRPSSGGRGTSVEGPSACLLNRFAPTESNLRCCARKNSAELTE